MWLSVILPIRCRRENRYLVPRLAWSLRLLAASADVEVIVVDSASDPWASARIAELCARHGATLLRDPDPQEPFAPGHTRNAGAAIARGAWLFFYDVDLVADASLVRRLHAAAHGDAAADGFFVVPCLFLTEAATRRVMAFDAPALAPLRASFERGDLIDVDHLGLTHTLVRADVFRAARGYVRDFRGHGGEDFELLHRLAARRPRGARPADYYDDVRRRHVGDYRGFRAYLAQYALPWLFADLYVAHLWHPRAMRRTYFRRRERNYELLQDRLRAFDEQAGAEAWAGSATSAPAPTAAELVRQLGRASAYPEARLAGLLGSPPGAAVPPARWVAAKRLRKLVLAPRQFAADSRVPALRRLARRATARRPG
jgi:predicted glycosyltransferase involved in capsule biosynthesis